MLHSAAKSFQVYAQLQPDGYAMAPFDPDDPMQRPRHGRGGYVATGDVAGVARPDLADMPADMEVRA